MSEIVESIKAIIRGTINLNQLKKDGLIVGSNFNAQQGLHCRSRHVIAILGLFLNHYKGWWL